MTEQEKVLMSAQAYPMPECQYQHSYDRMVTELIIDRREAYIQGINDTLKLLGKTTPKNEETTQHGLWVARDRDGKLIMFTDEPIKDEAMGVWDNFSPDGSFTDYGFKAPEGVYVNVLDSDQPVFDGFGRLQCLEHHVAVDNTLRLYLPARTAMVLRKA